MFSSSSSSKDQDAMVLSSIQVASQNWEAFQWSGKLDQYGVTLNTTKEAREQAQAARKDIVDTTKQFKRSVKVVETAKQGLTSSNTPETAAAAVAAIDAMSKECRVIVKAYQGEIDNLTRRCKNSETAFSNLYQALTEMPDPSAVLSTVLEQMQKQQAEIETLQKTNDEVQKEAQKLQKDMAQLKKNNKNESGLTRQEKEELIELRREVMEYEIETKNLKDQSVTVRKLEAKIAELQENAVIDMQEKLEIAQEELAETEGRRAAEALEREAAMERKVENLELQLKAERAGRAAAQSHLLDADEGAGEREAAWEAQRRILVDDSERLRQTLHVVTRERDDLGLKLAAVTGRSVGGKTPPASGGISMADFVLERKAYEAEVAELAHTASSLREELKAKDESVVEERRSLQAKVSALEQDKAALSASVSSLEGQLAAAPTQSLLNSMKRELRILKRLEYNADDVDAAEDPETTGTGISGDDDDKDLESVLVEKLRRAESDLVKERNSRLEQAKECERLRSEMEASSKAQTEAEKLVQSLEKDLERAIVAPSTPTDAASKPRRTANMPTPVSEEEEASTLNSILDPNATPPPPVAKQAPQASAAATEKAEDDHSVATIVMAQRDRLRARCEALEAERDSFKRELQVQVQSAESLKSDNTKLYEKVRYLQNFSGTGGNRGGAGFNKLGANDRDLDLEALEQRYEASVDPFRQFGRSERQRKLKEMPPMERIVFVVAKTVLGTKAMRTALVAYVTCLHLLVFITTMHWSHNATCDHSDHEHLAHLPPVVHEAAKNLKGG
ncbi:Protein CASP [Seminavis robusta]|uniref:Protein CASP n=1 Tax=Seminavis robusta TaxID=568900 RepID=A0A9N8H2B5_9STRA|nr:Protein CASP [Seminavis robusta]|eukprot:Sro61_g035010.1 Protein CASP (793) ;mRNA; r:64605-67089